MYYPEGLNKRLRLQIALARLGFASRRGAVKLIKASRVKVNGKTVLTAGERVDLERDRITVDDKKSKLPKKVYYILNKPRGVVTTVKDKYATKTVLDIIEKKDVRIYPVGRLDRDTSGLLLLSNDGELAYRLTHPRFGIEKVYQVCVEGGIPEEKIRALEEGIFLRGKRTYPCRIKIITRQKDSTKLEVKLTEGRKRQIKKMFRELGHGVLEIHRIAFGSLKLGSLKEGKWRLLKVREIEELKKLAGIEDVK